MAKRKTQKAATPQRNSPKRTWLFLGFTIIAALIVFAWYVFQVWKEQKAEEKAEAAIYNAFGINIPTNYGIHGIDVSSYQNSIAWRQVANMRVNDVQMGFAFIKSTEGLGNTDESFTKNYKNAKKAGMVCGAYHFFLATKSGAAQAANFIKNTPLISGDLPPVVDIEQLYGVPQAMMRKRLKEYLDTVEAVFKVKPIIYTYVEFYERYLGSDFDGYPLWVAHYVEQDKPRIGRGWSFWQHSEAGHVNGITTPVDCNVFCCDSTDFRKMLIP